MASPVGGGGKPHVPPPAPGGAPPPPPPPPPAVEAPAATSAGGDDSAGRSALFAELNKGTDISKGTLRGCTNGRETFCLRVFQVNRGDGYGT